jgi:hypothetical protein
MTLTDTVNQPKKIMKIAIFSLLFVSIFGSALNKYINDYRYLTILHKQVHKNSVRLPVDNTFDRIMRWIEQNENRDNQREQIAKNEPLHNLFNEVGY